MSSSTWSTTRAATVFVTIVALFNTLQWGPGGVQAAEDVGKDKDKAETREYTCSSPFCMQKCCEDGTYFNEDYTCVPANSSLIQWSPTMILEDREDVDPSKLQILYGMPTGCGDEEVVIYSGPFVLLPDGTLEAQDSHVNQSEVTSRYCLEYNQDIEEVVGVYCEPLKEEPDTESYEVQRHDRSHISNSNINSSDSNNINSNNNINISNINTDMMEKVKKVGIGNNEDKPIPKYITAMFTEFGTEILAKVFTIQSDQVKIRYDEIRECNEKITSLEDEIAKRDEIISELRGKCIEKPILETNKSS
ncbi:unnamed protein product [Meganyctiphanes norvegica]|uniref:Uncharacterized protein n=1 Tax=Meganyctiphanes norvegica TaxID=48144 RepID=A0AAV2S3P7_MEGNR